MMRFLARTICRTVGSSASGRVTATGGRQRQAEAAGDRAGGGQFVGDRCAFQGDDEAAGADERARTRAAAFPSGATARAVTRS